MRKIYVPLAMTSLLTAGCGGQPDSTPAQHPGGSVATEQHATSRSPEIPADLSFEIIKSDVIPGVKRSLEVRLSRKVSEEVLRAVAQELKNQDPRTYQRTFIGYYLEGMEVGAGGWATTHYDPDLEVRILGLTATDEQELSTRPQPATREVIGQWLDERPYVGGRVTLFREGGKLYLEQLFKDGSSLKEEMVERKSPGGRRFDGVEGSSSGDHWLLGADGNLQLRDNDGLISTARNVR